MLEHLKALRDRPLLFALLIGVAAQILFTVHIGRPSKIMFDEVHYLPAAQALLDLDYPRNTEHPLFGKTLLALGLWLFGDNPWGWRLIATFAGTATVIGAFAFVWLLLGNLRAAVTAALLVALNQTLFVQERTVMLDVFLGALILWAIVAMLWAARAPAERVWSRWVLGSALLGLAVGVKWAAIPYVALAGLAFLVIRVRDRSKLSLEALSAANQRHWAGLGAIPAMLLLGAVSILVYFLTFLPAFFYAENPLTLATLISSQFDMYAAQTQVLASHTYQSDWWSWPLMIRPLWFFYELDAGYWRGVLLIGNPVVMWGGLVAVAACLVAWYRTRDFRPLAVALLWVASVAIYAVIPKSLGFYYYYHLSGIFLCLAMAVAFAHFDPENRRGLGDWVLALALLVFVYFYPILAASPLRDGSGFEYWTWFDSWR